MVASSYPRYAGDGAGSYVRGLAQALVALGHSVDVVAPSDPLVAEADQRGVRVHRFRYAPVQGWHVAGHGSALHADTRLSSIVPLLMPGFAVAAIASALRLHREHDFDVFHAHWAVPGGFLAGVMARLVARPLVITLHGSDVYVIEHNALYAWAARVGFRTAGSVTGVCEDLLVRAARVGLDPGRSEVIPCGVDLDRYARGRGEVMRDRLGLPPDALVVGALGRLVHKKGFDVLIAALPGLLDCVPRAHCVIAGEGDLGEALKRQAEGLGLGRRVLFPGHVLWQDTPDYYAMCEVVAVPSVVDSHGNVDGLPNMLLEAMATGRAVVGSDLAGIPEAIEHERSGLLVPPGDAVALAAQLARVLGDAELRISLGRGARERMERHYGWGSIAQRMLGAYQRAVDAHGVRKAREAA